MIKQTQLLTGWVVVLLLAMAGRLFGATATEGTATLEFTTVNPHGKYSPKNVLAVWVTDANTNFVKTITRFGGKRQKYLGAWNQARAGLAAVDGSTGATLSSHGTRTATWDGCDGKQQSMPDGKYRFVVEFTDHNGGGPLAVFPFEKGMATPKQVFPDQKNFTKIQVTFVPGRKAPTK
ncbi:MAG: DUF2271 domain-containing protein [Verrucomicrobiota bacterium]